VHQNRAFFMERDGYIVDNPKVGPTLTSSYWKYGNSRTFLELVKELTGKELSGDDWVNELQQGVEELVTSEKKEYENSIKEYSEATTSANPDLNMVVRFVDGDTLISDSSKCTNGVLGACNEFEAFVQARLSK
jgi:glutamyl/glutaminyl-tRNA synthetase